MFRLLNIHIALQSLTLGIPVYNQIGRLCNQFTCRLRHIDLGTVQPIEPRFCAEYECCMDPTQQKIRNFVFLTLKSFFSNSQFYSNSTFFTYDVHISYSIIEYGVGSIDYLAETLHQTIIHY